MHGPLHPLWAVQPVKSVSKHIFYSVVQKTPSTSLNEENTLLLMQNLKVRLCVFLLEEDGRYG